MNAITAAAYNATTSHLTISPNQYKLPASKFSLRAAKKWLMPAKTSVTSRYETEDPQSAFKAHQDHKDRQGDQTESWPGSL